MNQSKEMISIAISNEQEDLSIDTEQLQKTVNQVMQTCTINKGTISIAVVNDDAMRALQQRYYGVKEVTDVLSFDLRETTLGSPSDRALDCEVVVNAQRARQAAEKRNQEPQAELNLYIVHGLLHQLGFDDQDSRSAEIMHQKEDELLEELGFGPAYSQGERG